MVAVPLDTYRQGLNLSTLTIFSTTFLLMMALLIQFIRTSFSAVRMIRHQTGTCLTKGYLLVLLLPLTFVISRALPNPNFSDGAAKTLNSLNRSDEMVLGAADEIAKISGEYEDSDSGRNRELRILAKVPFASLDLSGAQLRILNDSLLFEFGGPLTLNRWGFSVSGVKGKSPSLLPKSYNLRSISPEIIVFEDPTD